jgi:peptidyl-prolyl cis-trans isomerase SurA
MRFAIALLFLSSLLQGAIVLDRVAVIVGKHVIKTSDIERDLRVTEFLNDEQLKLSPEARHPSAERLIDQEIIRQEIVTGGYRRPADQEADALEKQLLKDRFGSSAARLREKLARYGLSEAQLHEQLLWQLTVLRFIDQRFRPGVYVTDEEVRAYYQQHLPELRRQYPEDSSFETLQSKVRSLLEGERINQNFTEWLEQARKRYRIEFRQEAFE